MKHRRTVRVGDVIHTTGKILPVGGSAAITLPKCWMQEHGLVVGDVVVKVANSILTVIPKAKTNEKASQ